jgi:hypothetical protein
MTLGLGRFNLGVYLTQVDSSPYLIIYIYKCQPKIMISKGLLMGFNGLTAIYDNVISELRTN